MYLSVQLAARRLGVSSHTIRRWTDSGLLPCIRTAGGHRRVRQEDVDELRALIGGGDQVTARLAREREVESLVEASIALTSRLDLTDLLGEVARRTTAILGCHFCTISEYDPDTDVVRVLADYDRSGQRFAEWKPYSLKQYPFSRQVMETGEMAVVRVSDPAADPAETAAMRRWGDKTMLLVPLVHGGRPVGLLEVYDHLRERRFTRQELRLAGALGGFAAVALHNAYVFARMSRHDVAAQLLATAVDVVADGLPRLQAAATAGDALGEAAELARRALGGVLAVASWDGRSATAGVAGAAEPAGGAHGDQAGGRVVRAEAPAPASLTLSVRLSRVAGEQEARVLRLVAACAAQALAARSRL